MELLPLQPKFTIVRPVVFWAVVFCVSFLFQPKLLIAQGNLMITPARVVFEGQQRSVELNLANAGKDTARYVISFLEIRMNKNGTFEQINEPDSGQLFASKYLRFFPRSVVLGPNEAQVIKLQLTGTAQLMPGEYRSHLYFRAAPDENLNATTVKQAEGNDINVKITPVFGITIPVIVRIGNISASVHLSDLSLDMEKGPRLALFFNRSGSASVYGDVTVNYISPQGKKKQVAAAKGLAVYTPNKQRYLRLPLENAPDINYHTGKIHVTYSVSSQSNTSQLAEAELQLK